MLKPEDSKRVADRVIEAIERIENRAVITLNELDDKIRRANIQAAIEAGLAHALIELERQRKLG